MRGSRDARLLHRRAGGLARIEDIAAVPGAILHLPAVAGRELHRLDGDGIGDAESARDVRRRDDRAGGAVRDAAAIVRGRADRRSSAPSGSSRSRPPCADAPAGLATAFWWLFQLTCAIARLRSSPFEPVLRAHRRRRAARRSPARSRRAATDRWRDPWCAAAGRHSRCPSASRRRARARNRPRRRRPHRPRARSASEPVAHMFSTRETGIVFSRSACASGSALLPTLMSSSALPIQAA